MAAYGGDSGGSTKVRIALEGKEPQVASGAYVAPDAVLIGDVIVEEGASVWWGAVLRADYDRIVVGAGSCVQDTASSTPTPTSRRSSAATSRSAISRCSKVA